MKEGVGIDRISPGVSIIMAPALDKNVVNKHSKPTKKHKKNQAKS